MQLNLRKVEEPVPTRNPRASPDGSRTMKCIRAMFAAASLFVVTGGIDVARADDDHSTTLYTPPIRAMGFHCDAVNVSRKTLYITISIIGADGNALPGGVGTRTQTLPGAITSLDVHDVDNPVAIDAYCSFYVFGTGDRKDLRADLNATLTRTILDTDIPIFLSRALEAH